VWDFRRKCKKIPVRVSLVFTPNYPNCYSTVSCPKYKIKCHFLLLNFKTVFVFIFPERACRMGRFTLGPFDPRSTRRIFTTVSSNVLWAIRWERSWVLSLRCEQVRDPFPSSRLITSQFRINVKTGKTWTFWAHKNKGLSTGHATHDKLALQPFDFLNVCL
jgi:hypothetical protein